MVMADDMYREHNMIRFVDGVPKHVWFSQHANGEAYTFDALEKDASGKRVRTQSLHCLLVDTTKTN